VEEEDAAVGELRQPRLHIVRDRLVGVAAVDVKEVDRRVGEVRPRLVERLREEAGKRAVERVVVGAQLLEDLGPVRPGVDVALPRVDGVAARPEAERLHRLAERAVGIALPRPELDEHPGPQRGDGEERERNVLVPAVDVGQPPRLVEDDLVAQGLERPHL
jgi:hypothetical protein